jgi:hypothetical protein
MKQALSVLALAGVLLTSTAEADTPPPRPAPVKLLLIGSGPDGHPAQTHEYMAGLKILAHCLKDVPGLEIVTVRADEPWREGPELIARADGVVLYLSEGARWMNHDLKRREALAKLAARGGGIAVLHWAMGTKDAKHITGCLQLLGGCHGGPDRKYKVLETDAVFVERLVEYRRLVAQGVLWTLKKPIPKDGLAVEIEADDFKLPAKPAETPKQKSAPKPRTDRHGDPLPDGAIARLGTVRWRLEVGSGR